VLPRAEDGTTLLNRYDKRRVHDHGQEMIGAVARRPVPVAITVVTRQQPIEQFGEICLRPGPELHHRHARGGMGHEHVEQTVAAAVAAERGYVIGEIDELAAGGVDPQLDAAQPSTSRAKSRSFAVMPPALWVLSATRTRLYLMSRSGW
jgi:hypothetical protein